MNQLFMGGLEAHPTRIIFIVEQASCLLLTLVQDVSLTADESRARRRRHNGRGCGLRAIAF
ncbi:MAG: hypothetical protein QQW96_23685 [Tychonema bourrellyi B0820]|nr:hypothetical protein [Tychonema bourrellyi B0820]